ncbi:MAG: GNAT family N-acetyltransferase [Oscillospiraceae bacterium]|nr:GNAT family N-acetyltransferase [Oscillospiraceae bacterium]
MTTIYLIRHAEAEGNVYRRLQGQHDSMITPNGLRQIEALARRFAEVPVDAVYASDLGRTCLTAGAVYRPKGLPLIKEPRFREICCGVWEDIPFGTLDRTEPELNRAFSHQPKTWQVEGSEPYQVYTGRFLEALEEVVRRHAGGTVCIFSHGMVMRGALQRLFFPDTEDLGHSENTAVSRLTWDGTWHLDYLNDASHLPQELSTLGKQQWWRGGDSRDFNMWYRDAAAEDTPLLTALEMPAGVRTRVAGLGDALVGAVAVEVGVLHRLALLPAQRGMGLSAQLLGEAVSLTRREGYRSLRLAAPADHPAAKKLLETYGFRENALELYQRIED